MRCTYAYVTAAMVDVRTMLAPAGAIAARLVFQRTGAAHAGGPYRSLLIWRELSVGRPPFERSAPGGQL